MPDAPNSTSARTQIPAARRRLLLDDQSLRKQVEEEPDGPNADRDPAGASQPSWVRFKAGHLAVVIADAPELSELTHAQFQLAGIPAVEGASGVEFLEGNAWIRLVLEDSINADTIARTLQRTFGGTVTVEEALPEERRVNLRYTPNVAPKRKEQSPRSRLWLRA